MATVKDVLAKGSFDYVVIGGGTAGLTLASKLTENPSNSVLVLEAGNDTTSNADILRPASYGVQFGNDALSWTYKTVKQSHARNREAVWMRGKGLGGSSGINFMAYVRPSGDDVDGSIQFELVVCKLTHMFVQTLNVLSFSLIHPYPSFVPPSHPNAAFDVHLKAAQKLGTHGPLKLSYPPASNEIEFAALEAFNKIGVPIAADPFGGDIKGVWMTPNTYDPVSHTRSYAATAYYLPHRNRPNYTVLLDAYVARIITKKTTNGAVTASGVEFLHDGKKYAVSANKEVIVSAGGLKSAQILELSGIGRKEVLEKINVPVQVDLRGVGTNVQEHIFHSMSWELKDDVPYDTLDILRDPKVAAEQIKLHSTGSGVYTSGMLEFCFVPPEMVSPDAPKVFQRAKEQILKNWDSYSPELQAQYKIQLDRIDRKAPGSEVVVLKGIFSRPNAPGEKKKHITFFNCMNHALSRVLMSAKHATSSDPLKDPEYDPHYLEMEADLDIMVEQLHFARKIASTSPLKDIIAVELNPGPKVQTDEQIRDWILNQFESTWHTGCACSMLPRDKGGVVDTQLKVYGTTNIRVADLSIIPIQVACHPMGLVYAIGEHAAEVIMGTSQL
ncbi:hypothetical protein EUX98_g9367 [Antrodiella citrinella]|uniref:Glucose-methanol-choline oxidoreductase N-terminal domain-containing protein n=1 Tax=Antrodiella citrinella TaxID=2447956 RepID=A0A4S4LU77_9APHY|nr:hypothetical protein EUX98_g9367 [Antrodiella citrinella]